MDEIISFPNFRTVVRANRVVFTGAYSTLEDIISHLYKQKFLNHHILLVYNTIRESHQLLYSLQSVRSVIVQMEPECCSRHSVHVLENTGMMPRSERVMYIRMNDYSGGRRVDMAACGPHTLIWLLLGLFAVLGIAISISSILNGPMNPASAAGPPL